MSRIRKILVIGISATGFWMASAGCSLHYHQQADSQTLNIEVMRPASANHTANRTGTEQ